MTDDGPRSDDGAWQDGILSREEREMLERLRSGLKLSVEAAHERAFRGTHGFQSMAVRGMERGYFHIFFEHSELRDVRRRAQLRPLSKGSPSRTPIHEP